MHVESANAVHCISQNVLKVLQDQQTQFPWHFHHEISSMLQLVIKKKNETNVLLLLSLSALSAHIKSPIWFWWSQMRRQCNKHVETLMICLLFGGKISWLRCSTFLHPSNLGPLLVFPMMFRNPALVGVRTCSLKRHWVLSYCVLLLPHLR